MVNHHTGAGHTIALLYNPITENDTDMNTIIEKRFGIVARGFDPVDILADAFNLFSDPTEQWAVWDSGMKLVITAPDGEAGFAMYSRNNLTDVMTKGIALIQLEKYMKRKRGKSTP